MNAGPWKIPQSVLVVVYTPSLHVLLMKRADSPPGEDFWQSVTGSKDSMEEDWAETAAREVFEETGIDARPGQPLAAGLSDWGLENVYPIYPRWLHRYAPGVGRNTERVWGLRVPEGTPVRLEPREHTAFTWLPWVDAAARCTSASNAEAILHLRRMQPQSAG